MKNKISKILNQAKISYNTYISLPLEGGANNRVYKITIDEKKSLILKHYFHHKKDLRKRLFSEFSFLKFAWDNGIRCIPEPLFSSEKENLGLYSFVPGRPASKSDISKNTIQQAIDFFLNLNIFKNKASYLPNASEACFTIDDHLNLVEKRIKNLVLLSKNSEIYKDLSNFVNYNLIPKWEKIIQHSYSKKLLIKKDLCISPSDFGFHNMIINEKKNYFIDFEYAGWDDPAKVVCDFFCQPKIPIPMSYFDTFVKDISSITSNPKLCQERINFLFPVYQIKWCCIILNIFLKTEKSRRIFSKSKQDPKKQLKLAKDLLNKIIT